MFTSVIGRLVEVQVMIALLNLALLFQCRYFARPESWKLAVPDAPQMAPDPNLKCLQVLEKMVGAIGFEPMTSTV